MNPEPPQMSLLQSELSLNSHVFFFDSVHNAGFLRISRLIASLLRLYEAQNYCRSNPVLIIIAASDCCSHSGV